MKDLFMEAVRAYARVCKNGTPIMCPNGEYRSLSYCEPSESLSEVGRKYVYLYNCNGRLVRYNIKKKEIII